jgi:hypothetical protein
VVFKQSGVGVQVRGRVVFKQDGVCLIISHVHKM